MQIKNRVILVNLVASSFFLLMTQCSDPALIKSQVASTTTPVISTDTANGSSATPSVGAGVDGSTSTAGNAETTSITTTTTTIDGTTVTMTSGLDTATSNSTITGSTTGGTTSITSTSGDTTSGTTTGTATGSGTTGTGTDTGGGTTTGTGSDTTSGTTTGDGSDGTAPADADGDGYTTDTDCDDGNIDIHPGANEVFGNGSDEDCDGYDFDTTKTLVVTTTGSDTNPDGTRNTTCLITAPCLSLDYVLARVAQTNDNVAISTGTYSLTSAILAKKSVTIQGGFEESASGVLASADNSLTAISLATGKGLVVRDVTTGTFTLLNLSISGNVYTGTAGEALVAVFGSNANFENVVISVGNGDTEGRAVSVSLASADTTSFTFENSEIRIGTISDTGSTATTKALSIENSGTGTLNATVENSTISGGTLVKGSTYTVTTGFETKNSSSGVLNLTVSDNTFTIPSADMNVGLEISNLTTASVRANVILLGSATYIQSAFIAAGNAASGELILRDNYIASIGDASTTTSYNIMLGDISATILNNTIVQDAANEAYNLRYMYDSLSGQTLDVSNNIFYNRTVTTYENIDIQATLVNNVDLSTLDTNDFWNVSGSQVAYKETYSTETDCYDGIDNDNDGATDCTDKDCSAEASCAEDCNDNTDNNGNGLVDCDDGAYCMERLSGMSMICSPNALAALTDLAYDKVSDLQSYLTGLGYMSTGNLYRDPLFFSTTFTQEQHLKLTSPLANKGTLDAIIDAVTDTDVFGNARVQGTQVDIGAEEVK